MNPNALSEVNGFQESIDVVIGFTDEKLHRFITAHWPLNILPQLNKAAKMFFEFAVQPCLAVVLDDFDPKSKLVMPKLREHFFRGRLSEVAVLFVHIRSVANNSKQIIKRHLSNSNALR